MDEEITFPAVIVDGEIHSLWERTGDRGPVPVPGYVMYPPKSWDEHSPPSLVKVGTDLSPEQALLTLKDEEWHRTGNPVAAVESIIMRHEAGVFPSVAVMDWLAAGLEDWHNHQGHKSLEQCLGLKKGGGHTANQMKEATRAQMVDSLLEQMLHLHCAFGIHIKDAAAVVAAWTEDPAFNQSTFKFRPLSEDTLMEYWKGRSWCRDEGFRLLLRRRYQDESERRKLLDQYPTYTWDFLPELKAYR